MSFSLKDKLAGKHVVVKIDYLDEPALAKIASADETGIWIEGGDILAGFHQKFSRKASRGQVPAIPPNMPLVFVPYTRIQWLAAPKE